MERTAHFLCEVRTRLDIVGLAKGAECEMPMTQQDIADVLGLSSLHVKRSLHELRTRGLVEFHHKRLIIPDQRKVEQLAMFDPAYLHRRAA